MLFFVATLSHIFFLRRNAIITAAATTTQRVDDFGVGVGSAGVVGVGVVAAPGFLFKKSLTV